MAPAAARIGHLSDVFAGTSGLAVQDPPVDALAGFDVVAQFSHSLLNLEVVRSLTRQGVASLSAYVPWGAVALPADLLASIPQRLRITLSATPARLEVRLTDPYLARLRWPVDVIVGPTGPPSTMAHAAGPLHDRFADIAWRVEINLLTPRFDVVTLGQPEQPPPAPGPPMATTGDTPPASDDASWDRLTLAAGQAVTSAYARQDVPAGFWRFGMTLDFTAATAVVSSDAAGVTEFLEGDAGQALLAQAESRLRNAVGVRLSPEIAPAGALAVSAVTHADPPAFHVHDTLLVDSRGDSLLALCAQLAGSTGGVLDMVPVLLTASDFAYAASEDVLRPAYESCWSAVSAGATFVGETPVEIPVGDDPHVTATGRAQLYTSFASTLDDVSIDVTAQGHADAVCLLVNQHVQLLHLWDHNGNEITDLGDLANPVDEPVLLSITVFETGGASPSPMNPNFAELLLKLLVIQVLPTLEMFPIRPESLSGYCSAALKTLLVRWALRTWRDDVRAPTPVGVLA